MSYKTIKFKDACKLVRGVSYKSSDYTDENDDDGEIFVNLKCVMPNGFRRDGIKYFNGSHKESQYINTGDLLIANTDLTRNREVIGNSILVPEFDKRACFSMDLTKIEIINESILDKTFLYYYLKSPKARWFMINHSDGSTVVHLSTRSIPDMDLEIPDLETQKKIVRILSALDNKIRADNELIDSLYSLGDAIYQAVHNGNSKTVTLKDISVNYDKKRIPLSSRQRSERRGIFPYYGATSILDYVDDYIFDGEYVLLGEDGTVMTNKGGAVLQYIWGKNWVNNHAHVLQGNTVSTEYLLFALRSVNVSTLVTGAVQPKINQENMNKIKLSIGPNNEMVKAEKSMKIVAAQIRNLTNENKTISELRDTLLPKLMSGEINLDKVGI